jgi:hypothetical protein
MDSGLERVIMFLDKALGPFRVTKVISLLCMTAKIIC